jgi:hypothetical protein
LFLCSPRHDTSSLRTLPFASSSMKCSHMVCSSGTALTMPSNRMSECSTLINQHASRTDGLHMTFTKQNMDKWRDMCEVVAGIEILRLGSCLTQCSPEASQVSVANFPPKDSKLVHAMPEGNKLPKP